MGWEEILKRRNKRGVQMSDRRLIKYILRDGEFRTFDAILDEIYDLIEENKKLGDNKIKRIEGRPTSRRFGAGKEKVKQYMTMSPDYESRDTGNKAPDKRPILEYRYIGE